MGFNRGMGHCWNCWFCLLWHKRHKNSAKFITQTPQDFFHQQYVVESGSWGTTLPLGRPIFKGELLVSARVNHQHKPPAVCKSPIFLGSIQKGCESFKKGFHWNRSGSNPLTWILGSRGFKHVGIFLHPNLYEISGDFFGLGLRKSKGPNPTRPSTPPRNRALLPCGTMNHHHLHPSWRPSLRPNIS